MSFSNLQLGVDNLRYDVFLSPRVTADLSFHLARYIAKFGEVESLFEMDGPSAPQTKFNLAAGECCQIARPGPADLKSLLVSIHLAILNRAKAEGNPSIDLLGRLAVLSLFVPNSRLNSAETLEHCRLKIEVDGRVCRQRWCSGRKLFHLFRYGRK